jgi:hypothetical protein
MYAKTDAIGLWFCDRRSGEVNEVFAGQSIFLGKSGCGLQIEKCKGPIIFPSRCMMQLVESFDISWNCKLRIWSDAIQVQNRSMTPFLAPA